MSNPGFSFVRFRKSSAMKKKLEKIGSRKKFCQILPQNSTFAGFSLLNNYKKTFFFGIKLVFLLPKLNFSPWKLHAPQAGDLKLPAKNCTNKKPGVITLIGMESSIARKAKRFDEMQTKSNVTLPISNLALYEIKVFLLIRFTRALIGRYRKTTSCTRLGTSLSSWKIPRLQQASSTSCCPWTPLTPTQLSKCATSGNSSLFTTTERRRKRR